MQQLPERDWKYWSKIRPNAVNRFCERILKEIATLSLDGDKTAHERYLQVYSHVQERDSDIDRVFDYHRRSTALPTVVICLREDLITPEELAGFSDEARAEFERWLSTTLD